MSQLARTGAVWLRKQVTGIAALTVALSLFWLAYIPGSSADEDDRLAGGHAFEPMSIGLPGGFRQQTVRKVNRAYRHIESWISSVGAAIAMDDLDADGLDNDLCIVDPRIDQVVLTPAPGAGSGRYKPFALDPGSLPMNTAMAPMGCVPGDFNEDGRSDLLVYMWGRTPILYLHSQASGGDSAMSAGAYRATELVPDPRTENGKYAGTQWNSNAATVADFDGDGHDDIFVGNYFPDSPVLDPDADGGVQMNDSMSAAYNGGENYILRWKGPAEFEKSADVVPAGESTGWTLATAAADLDGDLLPELYVANDFGPDRMYHNESRPGRIELRPITGSQGPMVPKSKSLGHDSFKGMGIDFGDLDQDGLDDLFASNITTSFGIHESNFHFLSTARDRSDLRRRMQAGEAPWRDESAGLGTAWSGWGWDVKLGDFDNNGDLEIAQATGFVKGRMNRWPQLQELATANDGLLSDPKWWPKVGPDDDIAGNQRLHFFVRNDDGHYVDLAERLGLAVPVPTRGIATGDADGDGRLDFAVARQWEQPVFYHNESPSPGRSIQLRLTHEGTTSPVIGAQVTATTSGGHTYHGRVDGGSGHSGKRSHQIHLGLGKDPGPLVKVTVRWRDRDGDTHEQRLRLAPGRHWLELGSQAKER